MNIKEAARQTGLTKKAIKYYEQEGLITVSKTLITDTVSIPLRT